MCLKSRTQLQFEFFFFKYGGRIKVIFFHVAWLFFTLATLKNSMKIISYCTLFFCIYLCYYNPFFPLFSYSLSPSAFSTFDKGNNTF